MTTTSLMRRLACVAGIVALAAGQASGVSTKIWELQTAKDFGAAKALKGLSLHSTGLLRLAPKQIPVKGVDELLVLCLAADAKGNVYAGTGDKGKIIKVDAQHKATVVWTLAEQLVTALAVDAKGDLYAAAGAEGKIYKLAFVKGKPRVSLFCDLDHTYVWAMRFDKAGKLVAAASLPEAVYSIATNGKPTKLADLGEGHLSALTIGPAGNVFTASEPAGIVYKISPTKKVKVLYDAAEDGVHALLLDKKGNLYVGTAGGRPSARGIRRRPPRPAPTQQTKAPAPPPPPQSAKPRKGAPPKDNAVYRIAPDGRVKKVISVHNGYVYALVFDAKGRLLVATGNNGKVFRIESDKEVTDLIDRKEAQVLALLPLKRSEVLMATGNKGRLVRMAPTPTESGAMESDILDATFTARWGRIWWDADVPKGAALTLATRSGNSAKPDKTWSAYSAELTNANGSKITSQPGRYLQIRASFKAPKAAASPVLRRIRLAYLPDNQPPSIASVGTDGQSQPGKAGPPKAKRRAQPRQAAPAKSTTVKLVWKAQDPNADQLMFEVYYRGSGEKAWKLLKDKLQQTSLDWNTDRVPDGEYRIKVVASDSPSNPPGAALKAEKVSLPILVDNTRPAVSALKATALGKGKCSVTGAAKDSRNYIAKLEYSVDAGDWVSFYPSDRILDSPSEAFAVTISDLKPGEHTIVVAAADAAGNVGSAKTVVRVK